MSEQSSKPTKNRGSEDIEAWDGVKDWDADLRQCEHLAHKSPTVGLVNGKAVTDSDWVCGDSDSLECESCRHQLQVHDWRWFGEVITGTRQVGDEDAGFEKLKTMNAWVWKLVCPCCEQSVIIAETTYDKSDIETIQGAYTDEQSVMSEESLEVSIGRVMDDG